MRYELRRPPLPLTEKQEILHGLKLTANYVALGDRDSLVSAQYVLDSLIVRINKPALKISIAKPKE